jgi:SAM-dependent methyltransferase
MSDERRHWEDVYATKDATDVSWFEATPEVSLRLIEASGVPREAAIADVGGGASRLAAELAGRGYSDITVADLSAEALAEAGTGAEGVSTVVADVRDHDFGRRFDLWHDRAVFHFMVDERDQAAYLATLNRSLRRGGSVVIATFGPDGPERCSGLPVVRYGAAELAERLGPEFEAVSSELHEHTTPSGNAQQFLYATFRRAG